MTKRSRELEPIPAHHVKQQGADRLERLVYKQKQCLALAPIVQRQNACFRNKRTRIRIPLGAPGDYRVTDMNNLEVSARGFAVHV